MSPVIDVHTHMLNNEWLKLLEKHGRPRYTLKAVTGGLRAIHLDGAPFMTPVPEMFDWDLRIKNMDRVGIDVSVVSLTCPNVYWGGEAVSVKAAQVMNDEMAKARKAWPDRIQWFCSLPWQYEKAALAELKRSLKAGACGVMVLANIGGKALTDPELVQIIGKTAKQRRDTITEYERVGRPDLAAVEAAELAVIEHYLPQQLSPAQLEEIVRAVIAETGAQSVRDMNKVMPVAMQRVAGQADGRAINQIVRQLLG